MPAPMKAIALEAQMPRAHQSLDVELRLRQAGVKSACRQCRREGLERAIGDLPAADGGVWRARVVSM